jgi:excisionase family DNA binding protein
MSAKQNIVHLPTQPEMEEAKISSRMLSKYADADRVQMSLRGSNGQTEDIVLPGQVLQLLLDILSEMAKGNAISLVPIHHELSTQDAANLLNVSRPHLVSLLEKNELPFRKVGAHRRVLAKDLLEYKGKMDEKRKATLDELAALSQTLGMGYDN